MSAKTFTSRLPQEDDSEFDLAGRQASSLAGLQAVEVAGVAALLGGAAGATSSGQIMASRDSRADFAVQNTGTNTLVVEMGATAIELRGASGTGKGDGGSWRDRLWKGAVSISGTSPKYNWSER